MAIGDGENMRVIRGNAIAKQTQWQQQCECKAFAEQTQSDYKANAKATAMRMQSER
jgi:hypothetical protein